MLLRATTPFPMASSSRRTWKYDVFPSFSGVDVRKTFLSHLQENLKRKLIITFIDHGIERSRPIAPELLSAIRESRIAIVVFSMKYASSTWCLNELAEIHNCHEESDQMVIPIFYEVDPSHVRKQTGEFGEAFEETCKDKTEDEKQRWIRALAEVASIAGYDSRNWSDEPKMIEEISSDVSKKLFTPSDDFRDFVGIEAHIEAIMFSKLCLESEEVTMVGILGPSGIGKTIIARALFSRLSSHFQHRAFFTPERAARQDKNDDYSMKLGWAKQLLSELIGQKDIEIESLGMVKQRLKHSKVLIVLDDVDEIEPLDTLVGRAGEFGLGSRIIVVTQDRALLNSCKIDLIYEVQFPSEGLALQMFCQSAFRQTSPPDGFMELAAEVAKLAGNLPLGLNVLGLYLRGKDKEEWMMNMPRLRKGLDGKIEKILRLSYDRLDAEDQEIFLYIACLLNGHKVNYIRNVLGDRADIGLRMLEDKSLVRTTSSGKTKTVEMHYLLQMLGRDIVHGESIYNPGKRRFLVDAEDISDVFSDKTGTEAVLGICFNTSEINGPFSLDENSFQGMYNLRFLKVYKEGSSKSGDGRLYLPQGLVYLPRKLRILYWDECPLKCLPSNFKAEFLVNLSMKDSKLDMLWKGTLPLGSLKTMSIARSRNLKEIPDLSYATNLRKMDLLKCTSLVTLPSSIRTLKKLRELYMTGCSKLEVLPAGVNLESLDHLHLGGCSRLRSFPKISKNISKLTLNGIAIEEEDCLWIENISGFTDLFWYFCPLRCLPSNFRPRRLSTLAMRCSKLEKLWQGVQSHGNLLVMDLSGSENLKEFPNLSKAPNLLSLSLNDCKSLVTVPCSIQSLNKLMKLSMKGCTGLESLPTNLNLKYLSTLNLSGCSQLKSFPQISRNIKELSLNYTAIEEVPSWIKRFSKLTKLEMRGCKRLKNISPNIFGLEKLEVVDFSDCEEVTEFGDAGVVTRISRTINGWSKVFILLTILLKVSDILCAKIFKSPKGISHSFYHPRVHLHFDNCINLDRNAQKLIIQSNSEYAVLPGGQVPKYFTHQASGNSLSIPLPKSSLLEELLEFKVCILLSTVTEFDLPSVRVCWYFRGKCGMHRFQFDPVSTKRNHLKMDHLLVSRFGFRTEKGVPVETEDQPELDYDTVLFEFYPHICGCSNVSYEPTCYKCLDSVQRIKGYGMQLWHVSPSRNNSDDDDAAFEAYSVSSLGKSKHLTTLIQDEPFSAEREAEITENVCIDDYKSLPPSDEEENRCDDTTDDRPLFGENRVLDDDPIDDDLDSSIILEKEDSDGHLTEELNFSSFFEEEEDSNNLPTHYTSTGGDIDVRCLLLVDYIEKFIEYGM